MVKEKKEASKEKPEETKKVEQVEVKRVVKGIISREEMYKQSRGMDKVKAIDVKAGKMKFVFDDKDSIFKIEATDVENKERQIDLDPIALHHMTRNIGLDITYVNKCMQAKMPSLLTPQLNYWYKQQDKDDTIRFIAQGQKAVAVSTHPGLAFFTLPNLLEALEKQVGKDAIVGYHNPQFDWFKATINLVTNESFEVVKKDALQVGFRLTHSFADLYATEITAYVYRLVCSNGATTTDEIASYSRGGGDGEEFKLWLTTSVNQAKEAVKKEKDRLLRLTTIEASKKTGDILHHVLGHVPRRLGKLVEESALNQGVRTMYDVYNVITEISTHEDQAFAKNPASRFKLEGIASSLSFDTKSCPVCNHKMIADSK
jgi:hypothetical protein